MISGSSGSRFSGFYVVAFRQMSVPLGVLLGLVVLGEPLDPPKLAGVLAVTAGLVLVAVG